MKIRKEYCEKICNYYKWIENDSLDNLAVISYNTFEIVRYKEKFWQYCKNELLKDLSLRDTIYIYDCL